MAFTDSQHLNDPHLHHAAALGRMGLLPKDLLIEKFGLPVIARLRWDETQSGSPSPAAIQEAIESNRLRGLTKTIMLGRSGATSNAAPAEYDDLIVTGFLDRKVLEELSPELGQTGKFRDSGDSGDDLLVSLKSSALIGLHAAKPRDDGKKKPRRASPRPKSGKGKGAKAKAPQYQQGQTAQGQGAAGGSDTGGAGKVLVGIIDYGLDISHPNFCRFGDPRRTRLIALWDQRDPPSEHAHKGTSLEESYGYGREFSAADIDIALKSPSEVPHKTLGYEYDPRIKHGTLVTDVAAGNGKGTGIPGGAPEADLVFVDARRFSKHQKTAYDFGGSKFLLDAAHYIFSKGSEGHYDRVIVNISLGAMGGPHDGTSLTELGLDALVAADPDRRAIVMAAGNHGNRNCHVRLHGGGRFQQLTWRFFGGDPTENAMGIWYDARKCGNLRVGLRPPEGPPIGEGFREMNVRNQDERYHSVAGKDYRPVAPGELQRWKMPEDPADALIVHRRNDPNNDLHHVMIFLLRQPRSGPEDWNITIELEEDPKPDFVADAWLETDCCKSNQARFASVAGSGVQITEEGTISSIACGKHVIAVGVHDPLLEGLSADSGRGPRRDDSPPNLVGVPVVGTLGASATSGHGPGCVGDDMDVRKEETGQALLTGGTSIAAAKVTGMLASGDFPMGPDDFIDGL